VAIDTILYPQQQSINLA